jgi:LAS superfamily LD-carboxypeptidase LdcB
MSRPVPENPLEIKPDSSKLELGKLANEIMPKTSLGKLAEQTTKVIEGVEKMIKNLPPDKLAIYVGALTVIVASLTHDNSEKEYEKKEPAKSEKDTSVVSAVPKKPETPPATPVISEKEKYEKRAEIKVQSGDRILKYAADPDAVARLLKMKKDEPLVTVEGGEKLKESVAWAYARAREIAKGMGYDIIANSGYRPPERQKELYDAAKPENRGRLIAAPGDSWHQSGGAGDFSLVKIGGNESLTQVSSKADNPAKYTDILEYCMNRAGFVRYSQESWHFEIGSSEWVAVMEKRGVIKKDEALAYVYKKDKLKTSESEPKKMVL